MLKNSLTILTLAFIIAACGDKEDEDTASELEEVTEQSEEDPTEESEGESEEGSE